MQVSSFSHQASEWKGKMGMLLVVGARWAGLRTWAEWQDPSLQSQNTSKHPEPWIAWAVMAKRDDQVSLISQRNLKLQWKQADWNWTALGNMPPLVFRRYGLILYCVWLQFCQYPRVMISTRINWKHGYLFCVIYSVKCVSWKKSQFVLYPSLLIGLSRWLSHVTELQIKACLCSLCMPLLQLCIPLLLFFSFFYLIFALCCITERSFNSLY